VKNVVSKRKGASSREHKSGADAHMKERMVKDEFHSSRPKTSQGQYQLRQSTTSNQLPRHAIEESGIADQTE
jgi:hypothetical protein